MAVLMRDGCVKRLMRDGCVKMLIIIIILIKRYSLISVKLTALYKHLITKTTLTYISANKTLIIVA